VVEGEGLLEISSKGFGFLRQADTDFQQAPSDVFVTPEVVRAFGLRDGMWLKCAAREGNRGPQLTEVLEICGKNPADCRDLPYFEELTAINPDKRLVMETRRDRYTTRVIDLIAPIGRGQRGLIVAPPRTGKTTLLQHLAESIHQNHEAVKIFILLVDERPEEVTELRRALPYATVLASSNDQDVKNHTRIAQLAIERCKRLVETGQHVFLLLDSITRMARAFNNAIRGGGNRGTASGGLAVGALETPRRLFAAARNTREGGSLTIIGTALIETNSRMDDAIFQEFKGTGNMELVLDRKIAEQYVWPAVNIHASGTRREELLLPPHQLEKIHVIRRGLAGHKPVEAMERLLSLMERFPSNAQMLVELKSGTAS
jgi:transcription termination factor Rho